MDTQLTVYMVMLGLACIFLACYVPARNNDDNWAPLDAMCVIAVMICGVAFHMWATPRINSPESAFWKLVQRDGPRR